MHCSRLVSEFRDAAGLATTLPDLVKLTESVAAELGFEFVAILHSSSLCRRSAGFIRFDNYPVDWERHLVGRGRKLVDPVLLIARRRVCAFRWADELATARLSDEQLEILAEAARRGIKEGVTVPANVPGEPEGSITFATRRTRVIRPDRVFIADAIGRVAFEGARRITGFVDRPANLPHVSGRVRECIFWIAQGKTDQDVATILGIGLETVRTYIKSAFRYLDVTTRAQLVHEALRVGVIDFVPPIPPFG